MSLFGKIKSFLPIRSGSFYARMDELEKRIVEQQYHQAESSLSAARLDELKSEVGKLSASVARIGELKSEVGKLSASVARIGELEKRIAEVKQISSAAAAKQNELQTMLSEVSGEVGSEQMQAMFYSYTMNRLASFADELLPLVVKDSDVEAYSRKLLSPAGNSPEIPVVFITDSNYIVPMMTAASSLFRHADPAIPYRVHVLGYNLAPELQRKYSRLTPSIVFHDVDADYSSLTVAHQWVSPAALLKFELPNIFPQYDKILYLDSDVLIYEDLKALYDLDLGSNYLAAVKDMYGMNCRHHHHRKVGHDSYFNSGMMLLNLKKMREDGISAKLYEAKKNDPWKQFMDQDALNVVMGANALYVSPKYNMMLANNIMSGLHLFTQADFYKIPYKEMKRVSSHPAIQHFSNVDKPWFSPFSVDYEKWQKELLFLNRVLELREKDPDKGKGA